MSLAAVLSIVFGIRSVNAKATNSARFNSPNISAKSKRKGKGNVDAEFFNRITKLLKIVIPKWKD